MTQSEWQASDDPDAMLRFLAEIADSREVTPLTLRSFAVACCRRAEKLLDEKSPVRMALAVAERFCFGEATLIQSSPPVRWNSATPLDRITRAAHGVTAEWFESAYNSIWSAREAAYAICSAAAGPAPPTAPGNPDWGAAWQKYWRAERAEQSHLLRCVMGDPFVTLKADGSWLTANVVDLARTICDERAFDRLPILSDALMDAGCTSQSILDHCRCEGPHARGCWVVKLLLGKS